jgi:hypothetical protein
LFCFAPGAQEDEEKDVSSYWMTLKKKRVLEIGRGRTRSYSVENSLLNDAVDLKTECVTLL